MLILYLLLALVAILNIIILLKTRTGDGSNINIRVTELNKTLKDELTTSRKEMLESDRMNREELAGSLKYFEDKLLDRSDKMISRQEKLTEKLDEKFEKIRDTVQNSLENIQENNSKKLEHIRQTVDEKLHQTLDKRLSESFKIVSDKLEEVHKGLGEMQELAKGVGDLKKVLSNVKTRGIFGEIQLGNILGQILSSGQYETNVRMNENSSENVEFAVKIPRDDSFEDYIYLPIDSKFPMERYEQYIDACESGDAVIVQKASKELESSLKVCAEDIRSKYINPPRSTDFAILFLPAEGLYAEIARRSDLISYLQREKNVLITGPNTLAALLNSFQMGFRTMAIQKRSGEVWRVLLTVKKEFSNFEDVLKKVQKKIDLAGREIENLVGTRTRQLTKTLDRLENIESEKIPDDSED